MPGYGGYGLTPYGLGPYGDPQAGGAPTLQLLLDDGTGTFPYDITDYLRKVDGYDLSRGRQDELSEVTAGSLTPLTLNNTDGRFTPGSTVIADPSPIVADQRIRLKVTAGSTTVDRFTGYVQSWPVGWPGGKALSTVIIAAVDAQARAERRDLGSPITEECVPDSAAYYPLDEPAGAVTAADTSGNQAPLATITGSGSEPTFGSAICAAGGPTGVTFAGGESLRIATSSTFAAWSFEFAWATTNGGPMDWCTVQTTGFPGGFYLSNLGSADGTLHMTTVTCDAAGNVTKYLDGVAYSTSGPDARYANMVGVVLGISAGTAVPYIGGIAHTFLHDRVLSAAEVASRADVILNGIVSEPGTDRISRVAAYASLPVGTLDASLTDVPAADFTGATAWETIREAAEAELGIAFVDGSGELVFHNRNRPALKTEPDITITAEAIDPGTMFVTDMQGVLNYFEVSSTSTGITQVVRNTTSEDAHGRYPGSASYLVQTDQEALDRANWIIATHAEPEPRVGTLVINAFAQSPAVQEQLLAMEPNTWVRVTDLPSQTPGGTTVDLMVQGFTEKAGSREWTITANVVSRSLFDCAIFDDPVRGVFDAGNRFYV